jgi:hypothetical protein
MSALDRALLLRFLDRAAELLEGDWIIMGGMVLPLMGVEDRVTYDIDIFCSEETTNAQTLVLLEIAQSLGIPPAAINQAGALFLMHIEDWRDNLVVVRSGAMGRILRPDVTLFILTKIGRLTERDLADCLIVLQQAPILGETPDARRILDACQKARRGKSNPAFHVRMRRLVEELDG